MRESVRALENLVANTPAILPVLHSHLDGYGGELIPSLLIAEVVDWMVDHRDDAPEVVTSIILWMNSMYHSASDELSDVIATGGVEAMPRLGEPGHELRRLLSAELQATDPWP